MRAALRRPGILWIALAILMAIAALGWVWWRAPREPLSPPAVGGLTSDQTRRLVERISALETQERQVAATVWAPEILAQHCGQTVDRLWDALNGASDRWQVLAVFPWPNLTLPVWGPGEDVGHGMLLSRPGPGARTLDPTSWRTVLQELADKGWRLARVEFRHLAFATNTAGGPDTSRYAFSAWVEHSGNSRRVNLQGDVVVRWSAEPLPDGTYALAGLNASDVKRVERQGPVPFTEVYFAEVPPPERSHFIDPILVHDLDRDGFPEIILGARHQVLRRQPDGTYRASALSPHPPGLIFTALLADVDHDGATDFVCARADGLILLRGTAEGTFPEPGRQVWRAPQALRYGQVITAADVEGDGDLDLWLGQYKTPFERGQMPTPYYAANDAYPAYLLLNDGLGTFTDATESAGLAPKRHRRTYSASFAELNRDGLPDLVVVSDFAGVDLYLNEGNGHFRDATDWLPDSVGFGMAHVFGDFDGDAELDLLVTGMHCPAARRLESLGLRRPGFESLDAMRGRMTQGNRLYQRRGQRFAFTDLGQTVSHSGWSWSPAAGDYDNDGYLDVYIANGHETRQSVVDYEPEFWLTDIYVGTSADDLALAAYFGGKFARTRGQGQSYGGYEANRLFLNRQARSFVEVGWLFGVAVEQDSRNAVPVDLDADGRLDLAVTTFEAWPRVRQTVRLLQNQLPNTGHWIGVRLVPSAKVHPFGSRITVEGEGGRWVRLITSGDLHRTQQDWALSIGLGTTPEVDKIEVAWPNGQTTHLSQPELGRYHTATAPD